MSTGRLLHMHMELPVRRASKSSQDLIKYLKGEAATVPQLDENVPLVPFEPPAKRQKVGGWAAALCKPLSAASKAYMAPQTQTTTQFRHHSSSSAGSCQLSAWDTYCHTLPSGTELWGVPGVVLSMLSMLCCVLCLQSLRLARLMPCSTCLVTKSS